MDRGRYFKHIASAINLHGEPMPGASLVEIAGDQRVLIERHMGVMEYDRQCVRVKNKKGHICICGENLELTHMTKNALVIYGCIRSITVSIEGE